MASCLSSAQGRVRPFVIRSSVRSRSLTSDVVETQSKFPVNYISSQPEQLGVTNS